MSGSESLVSVAAHGTGLSLHCRARACATDGILLSLCSLTRTINTPDCTATGPSRCRCLCCTRCKHARTATAMLPCRVQLYSQQAVSGPSKRQRSTCYTVCAYAKQCRAMAGSPTMPQQHHQTLVPGTVQWTTIFKTSMLG
jgi:hypothetical protein